MSSPRLRLDADDPDPGRSAFAAVEQPAISPPPPIGTTSSVEVGRVLEQLERGRALAGHDARVVVRRDERQAALLGERAPERLAVLGVAVVGDDLGAVAARRRELGGRRVLRHHDHGAGAEQRRRERDRLRVVARRERGDAARLLLLRQTSRSSL